MSRNIHLLVFSILALVVLACSAPIMTTAPAPTVRPDPTATSAPKALQAPEKLQVKQETTRETVSALYALNVREEPSRQARSLGVLYAGAPVDLTGRCLPGWVEIRYKSGRAWLSSYYVSGISKCEEDR
jgi:hypothetical protein